MGRRRSLTLRRRLYHAGASALVWLSALLCCALLLGLGGAVLRIAGNPTLLLVAVWMWLTNWRQI